MATVTNTEQADTVHAAERAREFGDALREMRVTHGRELADVADHLRIRKVYLQAIEEGRFDDLPGPTYAAGFVRAYADYLGLDVPEVVRRYKLATQGISTQSQLVPPSPVAEGRLPTGSVLLVGAILAAVVYGGWFYLSAEGRDPGEVVASLPQRIADMVGMKSDPAPAGPGIAAPQPARREPVSPTPPAGEAAPAVTAPPPAATAPA
ncbi:MAG: helix-turn-helix domain-containing protein, partial [Alphaproteobacteria bacterium]|nr:helix-turn-helix domain-containing protein [Alphaproteobacteria bacterium]